MARLEVVGDHNDNNYTLFTNATAKNDSSHECRTYTGVKKKYFRGLGVTLIRGFMVFKFVCTCKEGENLVSFNHVLDVVGHGYCLAADLAHAHASIAVTKVHVHGRNQPLNGNHLQRHPVCDKNIPGSPSLHANLNNHARGRAWLRG